MNCRPSPARPPRPRTRKTEKSRRILPPGSGLSVIAERKCDLPSPFDLGFVERAFPRARDVDAETPGRRGARFVAAENAGVFVVRTVVAMRVDRGGARLQPHSRLSRSVRNRLTDNACRQHARLQGFRVVGGGVPAVDAAAGQIDHGVTSVELDAASRRGSCRPTQRHAMAGHRDGGSTRRPRGRPR